MYCWETCYTNENGIWCDYFMPNFTLSVHGWFRTPKTENYAILDYKRPTGATPCMIFMKFSGSVCGKSMISKPLIFEDSLKWLQSYGY